MNTIPADGKRPITFPRIALLLEGGLIGFGAILAYSQLGASWWLFAALILAPDLFALGYLRGPKIGALTYNLGHTYISPALLLGAGYLAGSSLVLAIAVIWVAHIGLDRLVGYGLKYSTGFKQTHLARV